VVAASPASSTDPARSSERSSSNDQISTPCADCGSRDARTSLGGSQLCDRCLNGRVSERTGWSRLPDPPPVEVIRAADGREVRFRYRLTWAPSGVMSAEAEAADQPSGDGFRFGLYGEHDAEPDAVLAQLRRIVQRESAGLTSSRRCPARRSGAPLG
jgi:hypothetical protein